MGVLTSSERVARAYATLDLPPAASARAALRQYRRLVKRWHPDRYANDPRGQVEASQRMQEINAAFEVVRPIVDRAAKAFARRSSKRVSETMAPPSEPRFGRPLRPEEIDAIVHGIGHSSMIEEIVRNAGRSALLVLGAMLILLGAGLLIGHGLVLSMSDPDRWPVEVAVGCPLMCIAGFSLLWAVLRRDD